MEIEAGDEIQFRVAKSGTKLKWTLNIKFYTHQEGKICLLNINKTTIIENYIIMMIIYQASLKPYCSINGTFNIKIQTCCTRNKGHSKIPN